VYSGQIQTQTSPQPPALSFADSEDSPPFIRAHPKWSIDINEDVRRWTELGARNALWGLLLHLAPGPGLLPRFHLFYHNVLGHPPTHSLARHVRRPTCIESFIVPGIQVNALVCRARENATLGRIVAGLMIRHGQYIMEWLGEACELDGSTLGKSALTHIPEAV